MGRGANGDETPIPEVARTAIDQLEDLVGPTGAQLLLSKLPRDYFLHLHRREDEEDLRRPLETHPCGEPLYSTVYTSSLLAYRIAWELRDSGATLEEADRVCEQAMKKLGGGAGGELIFWAGWDDRGDGPDCVRRWHLIR